MTLHNVGTDRVLVARSVSKRFGPVRALDDVELVVAPGRVHALVGENGAGKSTLAKILAGIERPDAGILSIAGVPYAPRDRAAAKAAGVNMVPQQLSLVGELSLVENLLLTGASPVAHRGRARELLVATMLRAGVDVDPDKPVGALGQAHRQLGEIVVALAEGAQTLILDEPTASLGPIEVGGLFDHVRHLTELGTGILLITHRLEEVRLVADDVTVLSHGRRVHAGPAAGLEPARIAQLMVGDLPPARTATRATGPAGPVVLETRGLSAVSMRDADLVDIDLELRAGEVLGIAGVAGSGQNLLLDVLAGLATPTAGAVLLDGSDVTGRPAAVLAGGTAWIPEERSAALVPPFTVGENLRIYDAAIGREKQGAGVDAIATLLEFDVRPPHPGLAATGLSGGNQQKLLVARELSAAWSGAPRLVLAHGPTQGLDLRASAAIRQRLRDLARDGAAVLVASHDLEELLDTADRIVVLFAGRVVADLPIHAATTERLGTAIAGLQTTEATGGTR